MLTQSDFEQQLTAALRNGNNLEIIERYNAKDPLVLQQIRAMAAYLALFSQEVDIATIEPFIKSRDRSIIADITNKGILPRAVPCIRTIEITNNGDVGVSLANGRQIEDNSGGRVWRLLSTANVPPKGKTKVLAEQSEYREVIFTPQLEPFYKHEIELESGLYLADITIKDNNGNIYPIQPRWLNVAKGEYAVNVTSDSLNRLFVEFGDSERAGRTVENISYIAGIKETHGYIDISQLDNASLVEIIKADEAKLTLKFSSGEPLAGEQEGQSPLDISQLRVLSSYPSIYNENAVFLGNFDYLVRRNYMNRTNFISVWNERIHDKYFDVKFDDINSLHIAVVMKDNTVIDTNHVIAHEIQELIAKADSLYSGRVKVWQVEERPITAVITGKVAAVHNLDTVKSQISELLKNKYGKGSLAASRWLIDNFNTQEMASLIRNNIVAFQDRVSDFSITLKNSNKSTNNGKILPTQWIYIHAIELNLERSADSTGTSWIL